VAAPFEAAAAFAAGDAPAGPGPAQRGERGAQAGLVPLDGEQVMGLQLLGDQGGEGALRVECVGADDVPGQGEPLAEFEQRPGPGRAPS
jgi:hypothetical protein